MLPLLESLWLSCMMRHMHILHTAMQSSDRLMEYTANLIYTCCKKSSSHRSTKKRYKLYGDWCTEQKALHIYAFYANCALFDAPNIQITNYLAATPLRFHSQVQISRSFGCLFFPCCFILDTLLILFTIHKILLIFWSPLFLKH